AITRDPKRGIRNYQWAPDNKTVLYLQDTDGDENFHIYGADPQTGNVRDYTPFQGVRAFIRHTDYKFPDQILVTVNLRDRRRFDVYRLTLSTGALVLDTEEPGDVNAFFADAQMQVRAALAVTPEAGTELRVRDQARSPWKTWLKAGPDEILNFVAFSPDGQSAILISSLGSDTARAIEKNIATGRETVLASSPEVDPSRLLQHPTTHQVQAVGFMPGRLRWSIVDPA